MASKSQMSLSWIMSGKTDPSLAKATQAVTKNIESIKKASENVSKSFGKVTSKAASLVKYLSFGALAGGAPSLMLIAKNAAEAGDKFQEMSERVGLSANTLSKWSHAANMTGVSTDSFGGSVLKLNKLVADAAQGSKSAQLAFKRAGVSIRDSAGKIKSSDQIMMEMSDTFKKMPEGIYKSDLAMAIFGKSGAEMVPLLQGGSAAIQELMTQAEQMGMAFSNEEAQASAEFCDNLDLLKKSVQGVSYSIGKQLVPIISPLIASTAKWISANRELISSKLAEWIEKFKKALPQIKDFLFDVYENISAFASGVNRTANAMGGWTPILKNTTKLLVGLKGIQIAKWVYTASKASIVLGKSITTLIPVFIKFGMALMANPIGLVITGIAALVTAGYFLYKNWDDVVAWIEEMWDGLGSFFSSQFDEITSAFDEGFIEGILTLLKKFNPVTLIVKAIDSIFQYFTGVSLIDEGSKFINSFGEGILNTWNSIKDGIIETVTGWIPDWVKDGVSSVGDALSSVDISTMPMYSYGNGGLVNNRQIAEIGEDGAEMVIPLTKPERGKNLLMKAADMMGLSLKTPQSNNNSGDLVQDMARGIVNSNQSSTTLNPTFSPVISINGASNPADLEKKLAQVLDQQRKDFEKSFNELLYKQKRVGVF